MQFLLLDENNSCGFSSDSLLPPLDLHRSAPIAHETDKGGALLEHYSVVKKLYK